MHRYTPALALLALCCSLIALAVSLSPRVEAAPSGDPWRDERDYPPLIFVSKAYLDCSISSTENGLQSLQTVSGPGFSFMTPMAPITESELQVRDPGMRYSFNAFPTKQFPATFTGLGEGTVTRMRAEVDVSVDNYTQPGGPGTAIAFNGGDISADSAYV
ncbi:MAG: hypothetical protein ABI743_05230, partial [bacterium]